MYILINYFYTENQYNLDKTIFGVSEYEKSLEADLESETSGHFQRLLISLSCAGRDESSHVENADIEAKELLRAGKY